MIDERRANYPDPVSEEILRWITDRERRAENLARGERFMRNVRWLFSHWEELAVRSLGQYVAVSGEEAFAADTHQDALRLSEQAHPEDDQPFVRFINSHQGPMIHADPRILVDLSRRTDQGTNPS